MATWQMTLPGRIRTADPIVFFVKLERLRSEIQTGIDASRTNDVVEVNDRDLEQLVERIMTGGTEPAPG